MVQPQDTSVSLQYMLNGSRAVLTRPNPSTFEEYERNNLSWALIYISIAAVISAVLNTIAFAIRPPIVNDQLGDLPGGAAAFQPSLASALIGGLLGTIIVFLIYMGVVYLLGRAFGGTGEFGELAFGFSLFAAPLAIVNALVNIIAIGPLAFVTALIGLVLLGYNLYLTYNSIQSGMNLPPRKALYVILTVLAIGFVLACGFALLIGGLIAAVMNSSTAP
ncbi:MAG: YIP1 family protein [Chloroflexales bacterium]|nr:YIP1 family protein [Chloroflexales bacterium]